MSERAVLPEGLAEMPPGPGLGTLLASIDPAALNGHDAVLFLVAEWRQACYQQGRLLAAIAEVAHCPPGDADAAVERAEVTEFSGEEIRLALSWTERAVNSQLSLALDVTERLPQLRDALTAGLIDVPKAMVLSGETLVCGDRRVAREIVDTVLPRARELTTAELRRKVRKLVLTADPAAAAERTRRATVERRVAKYQADNGTATITALGLPVERAAVAWARLDAIAWAAKHAGDCRTIDQLRADAMLDLLTGAANPPLRGTLELTVPLDTLIGLAEQPGRLRGWGPVVADTARQVAEALRQGTWRVSVHDRDTAELLHHGITRRRPSSAVDAFVKARDGTCRAKGCNVPAHRTDLDHTRDWIDNGPTVPANLGSLCRPHHRYKHQTAARLEQPRPGVFRWTTALGHIYLVEPDPDP